MKNGFMGFSMVPNFGTVLILYGILLSDQGLVLGSSLEISSSVILDFRITVQWPPHGRPARLISRFGSVVP